MNRARIVAAVLLTGIVSWLAVSESSLLAQQPAAEATVKGPVAFRSCEGKTGWKVVLPGNKPLATPALADGKLFVGGGFGSHEFYGFDAMTGKRLWVYTTGDDGPSAAVVAGDCIAFSTESCELEIITRAGKPLWKKWLGDPLMSMPAIHNGNVYMTYPDSKGDQKYRLACFDLKTGKELWKQPIRAEAVTAPVAVGDQVYLTTLDGTLSCFGTAAGKLAWKEATNATSSPTVWDGKCYFSRRKEVVAKGDGNKKKVQQTEHLAARASGKAGKTRDIKETSRVADYLDGAKRLALSADAKAHMKLDASVGFGPGGPAAGGFGGLGGLGGFGGGGMMGMMGAGPPPPPEQGGPVGMAGIGNGNIGQLSVAGVWSYQGSRPFVYHGRLFAAMGDTVKCVDLDTRKVVWRKAIAAKKVGPLVDAALTPPAIVNGRLFLGSAHGVVYCLNAEDGAILWQATVGEPIRFQPAVVRGRVYVTTTQGSLICLETGDRADDGWPMWGRNAAHDGLVREH